MADVSVVIPTYNDTSTLARAINSTLKQTVSVSEIIIVDDASTDDPYEVVDCYDDERIIFRSHDCNRGGSTARNTGIDIATGEYLAFLDADDEWRPEKTERQLDVLQTHRDDVIAVHCDREFQVGRRARLGYFLSRIVGTRATPPKEGGEELIKEILLLNLSTGSSTLMIESDTVNNIGGFDPAFPRHQDWEFLIRILKRGKLAYVEEPLVIRHGTGRPSADVHQEAKELLFSKFDQEIATLEAEGYPIRNTQNLHLAKLYLEEAHFGEGLRRLPWSDLFIPEILSILWSATIGIGQSLKND
jgi:glycosyltransferase involved in cell wall biosynthesis